MKAPCTCPLEYRLQIGCRFVDILSPKRIEQTIRLIWSAFGLISFAPFLLVPSLVRRFCCFRDEAAEKF
jgi:hypothetical protein